MPSDDRRFTARFNTYTDATDGQRLTALVVALVVGSFAGLLCTWLASAFLQDTHWLVQTLAFAVIGLLVGIGALGLMSRLGTGSKR
jgi:hypothetical protein